MHPLLKTPKTLHQYKEGATFSKVMMLYRFDKKLRLLLFNEIEKIEIAVREAVMNMTAERTGDIYWLANSTHFRDQSIFSNSMALLSKEYERSTEDFIEHFFFSLLLLELCTPRATALPLAALRATATTRRSVCCSVMPTSPQRSTSMYIRTWNRRSVASQRCSSHSANSMRTHANA